MSLLLTILSVLAGWALLILLAVGLLLILKPLQSVRTHLERIAMGVRAIEQQTAPLGRRTALLSSALERTAGATEAAARGLLDTDRALDDAAPLLVRLASPKSEDTR